MPASRTTTRRKATRDLEALLRPRSVAVVGASGNKDSQGYEFVQGFVEIGFSAHLPKVKEPDPNHAMLEHELPRYIKLVESLRERYRDRIVIKLGIEADYFKDHEDETQKLLDAYNFDYVLGSIHFLGEWHFTSRAGLPQYKTEDPDKVFPRYFELLGEMIASRLFMC